MEPTLAELTREELYELVWSIPTRRLAERFSLSDVGLAKVCKRLNIPRPPVGYWAKKEAGKSPPRPPLPPLCNSLMTAARTQLLRGKPDSDQLILTNAHTAASIRVSHKSMDRALNLFQTLIELWNKAGGTVGYSEALHGLGTEFYLGPKSVPIHLSEIVEPVQGAKRSSPQAAQPTKEPTGQLMFSVPHGQHGPLPSRWTEDDQQKLEDVLPRIVQEIPAQIERWQVTRSDRECEHRQWQKVHARQSAKWNLDAEEREWEKVILEGVQKWRQAEQIRAYVAELRRSVDCGEQHVTNREMYEKWQAWANYLAIRIDPLMRSIPRPGEITMPVNTPVSQLDITSTTRAVVDATGANDTDELASLTKADLSQHTAEPQTVIGELLRVLEGLGYETGEHPVV